MVSLLQEVRTLAAPATANLSGKNGDHATLYPAYPAVGKRLAGGVGPADCISEYRTKQKVSMQQTRSPHFIATDGIKKESCNSNEVSWLPSATAIIQKLRAARKSKDWPSRPRYRSGF